MEYIISQIITAISYIILASTYQVKNRKTVLFLNCIVQLTFALAYAFLKAWSGLAMCIVALARNIIFIVDENKNGKRENINKLDIIVMITLFIISIISAIFTFEGMYSLLPVVATMIYTYAVCQKNVKIYKALGIPIEILYTAYNIFINSIIGLIFEIGMLVSCVVGYVREVKENKRSRK